MYFFLVICVIVIIYYIYVEYVDWLLVVCWLDIYYLYMYLFEKLYIRFLGEIRKVGLFSVWIIIVKIEVVNFNNGYKYLVMNIF